MHYHPTVALYATHLVTGRPLPPGASPDLSLHTLTWFLDRFVFRNPKKRPGKGEGEIEMGERVVMGKGGSLMQPAASAMDGIKLIRGEQGQGAVNKEEWWNKEADDVDVDQVGTVLC